ncbi:hypothetical protein BBP00_00001648 [Phytophthora kernoviae]|uniref:Protein kinase domain-containing protein n=1 Tax=Phytophthora kernoviae TaxID=325452 RepID=A0A3F2RZL7_9STRA|nr:hypothetical protein BBP00_00001648 [Phytophthora kernoviae]
MGSKSSISQLAPQIAAMRRCTWALQALPLLFAAWSTLPYVQSANIHVKLRRAHHQSSKHHNLEAVADTFALSESSSTESSTIDLVGLGLTSWSDIESNVTDQTEILNASHNLIQDVSGTNLSSATDLVSIDLSSNNLTSVVGVIFPSNLTTLDLSNNSIKSFEVRETDFTLLSNLSGFKMDNLEQSDCPTSSASTETIGNVQICVVSDYVFQTAYFRTKSAWQAGKGVIYLSVIVSALISLWFLALLVGHTIKRKQNSAKDLEQRDTMETSYSTQSRNWSLSKQEDLPGDVRFDPEFTSLRIDPSDVMQVRTLAHGGFAMTSLVHLGDKQAVMKKVAMHAQGQDRDQMLAFMDEIRVCAKLDHPKVMGFLGIMWASPSDLAAIVEYVPHGSLNLFLKEKKSARKSSRSQFTWMQSTKEWPSKISLALQISEALVYLQSFSPPVIHGHLKAECVLLGSSWEVKLSGLGYKLDTSSFSGEDRVWVAPEVLASGQFDEKSDIYSFGVVLSELDCCKPPVSHRASRRQSVESGILPKPKFCDDCPPEILQIAQSCLEDDGGGRPTAMELYYSFRQLQRQSEAERRASTNK